jgi:hypothetical protein
MQFGERGVLYAKPEKTGRWISYAIALSLWERKAARSVPGEGRNARMFTRPALTRRYAPTLSRRERATN